MKSFILRRALVATAMFAVPALAGTPSIEWRGAGWYLWSSGTYEGKPWSQPIDGAFADQNACLNKRQTWAGTGGASSDADINKIQYNCHYYSEPWPVPGA